MSQHEHPFDCAVTEISTPYGMLRQLKVCRRDGDDGISWDQLQSLKDEHLGLEVWAVEVYPPHDEVVDDMNCRHLFEIPAHFIPRNLHHGSD